MNKFLVWLLLMTIPFAGYSERIKIGLVPIDSIEEELLFYLKQNLPSYFDRTNIYILERMKIPASCFNSARNQFSGECILEELPSESNKKVLGIIDRDLYATNLNFIFGLATSDKALIAIKRLNNGFYGLAYNKNIFYQRVLKEANHELGHSFGLKHCSNPKCVMYFSNSLRDTDIKGENFCEICKRVLEALIRKCVW